MFKLKSLFSILIISLFFSSCANMVSGHYVQIKRGQDLSKISKTLKVPKWKIKEANPGKRFKEGEWVFVPLKRGIASHYSSNNYRSFFNSGEFLWPVPSSKRVSSNFGHRWGRKHEGIDIAARRGSHILAVQDGVVVYSGNGLGGYGNITVIGHKGGYFSVYAHAKKNYTRKGQKVHKGQVIALVGSTGRSTGPHLHFEIRRDSKALDPNQFLAKN